MDVKMMVVRGRPKGKSLRFPPGQFVFGRGPECHVRPEAPSVSRQHCLLNVGRESVCIRDLGSTHGTLVNGTRVVGERDLHDGDLLQLGPLVLRLCMTGEVRVETAPEQPPCGSTAPVGSVSP